MNAMQSAQQDLLNVAGPLVRRGKIMLWAARRWTHPGITIVIMIMIIFVMSTDTVSSVMGTWGTTISVVLGILLAAFVVMQIASWIIPTIMIPSMVVKNVVNKIESYEHSSGRSINDLIDSVGNGITQIGNFKPELPTVSSYQPIDLPVRNMSMPGQVMPLTPPTPLTSAPLTSALPVYSPPLQQPTYQQPVELASYSPPLSQVVQPSAPPLQQMSAQSPVAYGGLL
jgi:hypothetical protein